MFVFHLIKSFSGFLITSLKSSLHAYTDPQNVLIATQISSVYFTPFPVGNPTLIVFTRAIGFTGNISDDGGRKYLIISIDNICSVLNSQSGFCLSPYSCLVSYNGKRRLLYSNFLTHLSFGG